MSKNPSVYLVGAGPGDPGLITQRAIEAISRADIVFHDYLVHSAILELIHDDAERVCLGQHGRSQIWPQSRINDEIVRHAKAGKTVVRLKGGDPIVFGHVAEEAATLRDNNLSFEIVPGLTSALAAPSYAGVPLTHRDHASAVAFVTGQENPNKSESTLDYQALARFPGTLVFYMGVTKSPHWSTELLAAGMAASTPVVAIRKCTLPDQRSLKTTLGRVAEDLTPYHKFPPPALVIVGDVGTHTVSWFEFRPLYQTTVLVTRPTSNHKDALSQQLSDAGAEVIHSPAIEINPPENWHGVDTQISRLPDFDWLIFASSNGVKSFCDRLLFTADMRALGHLKIACVGAATAETLRSYSLVADVVPAQAHAEALADELLGQAEGKRFLFPRANRGRDLLRTSLTQAGAAVTEITVYESHDVTAADDAILKRLESEDIDWVTVTSSAIANSIVSLYGDLLHRTKLASISPITSRTLREAGFTPAVEATEYSTSGLVKQMLDHHRNCYPPEEPK